MKLTPGLHRIDARDIERLRRTLVQSGYCVFSLPDDVVDSGAFFEAIRRTLPLDPPVAGSHSWDALSDSLWEGLYSYDSPRIGIVWPGTCAFAASSPQDFETASSVLGDVADLLGDSRAAMGAAKEVVVLVESPVPRVSPAWSTTPSRRWGGE